MLLKSILALLSLGVAAADDEIKGPVIGIDLGTTYRYSRLIAVVLVSTSTAESKSSPMTKEIVLLLLMSPSLMVSDW